LIWYLNEQTDKWKKLNKMKILKEKWIKTESEKEEIKRKLEFIRKREQEKLKK
jgi:hypothetical protein